MAQRFFNAALAEAQGVAHHVITVAGKAWHLPVVKGVVKIPDELMAHWVPTASWVPFAGQVAVNDEDLKPIQNVDKHYAKKQG